VREHRRDRGEHAVQVEAIEADARRRRQRRVVGAQPVDELGDDGVAPHPGRKALEVGERGSGARVVADAADVAVDAVRVGPVGLDRDGVEAALDDQPPGQRGSLAVEVVGAVRRLADQREARVGEQLEERAVVAGRAGERHRVALDGSDRSRRGVERGERHRRCRRRGHDDDSEASAVPVDAPARRCPP